MMSTMDAVEVVVAHQERAVVRVGDVFLKIDADRARVEVELAAMERAAVPVPEVLWRRHPVLALARVPGAALGPVGRPSTAEPAAWAAAGEMARALHEQPVNGGWPTWYGADAEAFLAVECSWLVEHEIVAPEVVAAWREAASTALRPFDAVVIHGDLQPSHVFVENDVVTGVIDWADACLMDPLFDLAVLTVDDPGHLDDVVRGYGREVDRDVIRGWWALRRLGSIRWMIEHGFDATDDLASLRRVGTGGE
jgi:aminoglycoside phosphotransferase (APT) family kinase protein